MIAPSATALHAWIYRIDSAKESVKQPSQKQTHVPSLRMVSLQDDLVNSSCKYFRRQSDSPNPPVSKICSDSNPVNCSYRLALIAWQDGLKKDSTVSLGGSDKYKTRWT